VELSITHILKKGGNSIIIQGIAMLLTLVLNWLLSNQLGAKDYGIYTYAFSWVYFFGSLSILGLDSVLQRELIKYAPEKALGLIAFTRKINTIITASIVIAFALVVYFVISTTALHLTQPLILAILALPLYSHLLINKSTCIGLKAVENALIPENIIRPLVIIISILLLNFYAQPLEINNAILFNLLAFFIAYLASYLYTRKLNIKSAKPKIVEKQQWSSLGLTFFLLTATVTINSKADILMLGFFGETAQVGIYNIAVKLAMFIALPLVIVNQIITPFIAEYFESKQNQLALVIKKSIRIIFLTGSIITLIFAFSGETILSYFGNDFRTGYFTLIILAIGQLINLFVGPVGNVLTMSKYENLALKSMIWSTVINILLNSLLIPLYDIDGAALATFISLVYWNIAQFIIVKKKLNMNLSVI